MKTGPSSNERVVKNKYRQRLDAIAGKVKVAPKMFQGSLAPLLASLEKQRTQREQFHAARLREREKLAKARGPIQKPSPDDMAAFNAMRKARLNSGPRTVKPPVVPRVSPQVRSGSILSFDAPPYWYQWSAGDLTKSVNKLDGTWSTGGGVAGRFGSAYAGIAAFVQALPGRHPIRFAPYMPSNWNYDLYTTTAFFGGPGFASAKGFLGAYVSAYSDGQWVNLRDDRLSIFDHHVTVNTDESDSGDTLSYMPQSTFLTYDEPLYYGLMAWGGVELYGNDTGVGFGDAFASLACTIPWMVIEEEV